MATSGTADQVPLDQATIGPDQLVGCHQRQAMPDPWADLGARYPEGTEINGKVARVENFGAFVEMEEGIEGLLPVSEMSWQRIRSPKDVVKPGGQLCPRRTPAPRLRPPWRKTIAKSALRCIT